jgi:alpha-beta hydrolase superfamily lysophospholipase
MTIELDEGALTSRVRKGPDLYYASAMPSGGAKALLGIIPGYADHGARYRHVMGALAEHGIGSVAIDLRGHGRATGARGYCERFSEFLDDARELRVILEQKARSATKASSREGAGPPTFLFGHSFGGVVATLSAMDDPKGLSGLVLSAPFFGLALQVPRIKVAAGKVASRLYPKLALPTGLGGSQMTHEASRARDYDSDPLVFKNATARWFTEVSAAQEQILERAPRFELPLYMVFGGADPVASFTTGKRFFGTAGTADKTWDAREGLFHEVLNEPSWKDIADAIASWILAHAPQG